MDEETQLLNNAKYRQYVLAVEKALKSFESSSEWADLISSLGKVIKAIQSFPNFAIIPRRAMIGKRLAQCLHPALPGGVHLKALETYDVIFQRIGVKRLAYDLFIYSAGLFPLLANAAMQVKPILLDLYQKYYLPLGKDLLPALPGLLLGLLPGLEEGSEHFSRTKMLLDKVGDKLGSLQCFTALWQCVSTTSSVRLPALLYVTSCVDKQRPASEQLFVIGSDKSIVVNAICLALSDSNILVQRNLLDFLITFFSLHAETLSVKDTVAIVQSALNVLLRRDISLSRRFYAWLLGSSVNMAIARGDLGEIEGLDANSSIDTDTLNTRYFNAYSKVYVVAGVKQMLRDSFDAVAGCKGIITSSIRNGVLGSFRIILNLLDKSQIGALVVEDVLMDVLRYFHRVHDVLKTYNKKCDTPWNDVHSYRTSSIQNSGLGADEVIKSANLIFNTFEPYYLWDYLGRAIRSCVSERKLEGIFDLHDSCDSIQASKSTEDSLTYTDYFSLVTFLLDVTYLESNNETQILYLPQLLYVIIAEMNRSCPNMSFLDLDEGLDLCSKLLNNILPSNALAHPIIGRLHAFPSISSILSYGTTPFRSKSSHFESARRVPGGAQPAEADDEIESSQMTALDKTTEKVFQQLMSSDSEADAISFNEDRCHGAISETDSDSKSECSHEFIDAGITIDLRNCKLNEHHRHKMDDSQSHPIRLETSSPISYSSSPVDSYGETCSNHMKTIPEVCENSYDFDVAEAVKDSSEQNNGIAREDLLPPAFADETVKTVIENIEIPAEHNISSKTSIMTANDVVAVDEESHQIGSQSYDTLDDNTLTLMEACINQYLNFLEHFIYSQIIRHRDEMAGDNDVQSNRNNALHASNQEILQSFHSAVAITEYSICAKCMTTACRLLVEFSCFPINSLRQHTGRYPHNEGYIPRWLDALLTSSCTVDVFSISRPIVEAILDLIHITQSVVPSAFRKRSSLIGSKSFDAYVSQVCEASVSSDSVATVPLMSINHLNYLKWSTNFFKVATKNLWENLSYETPAHLQHQAANLLWHVNELAPTTSDCEDIIGQYLVAEDKIERMEALRRFTLLWHSVRGNSHVNSCMNRSLFVALDYLYDHEPNIRQVAINWLDQSLQQGDVGRLLVPILVQLLHPRTARVSAQSLPQDNRTAINSDLKIMIGDDRQEDVCDTDASNSLEDSFSKMDSLDVTPQRNMRACSSVSNLSVMSSSLGVSPKKLISRRHSFVLGQQGDITKRTETINLHFHRLLYLNIYDCERVLYMLKKVIGIITIRPRLLICSMASTAVGGTYTPQWELVQQLLWKHRQSLIGKDFDSKKEIGKGSNQTVKDLADSVVPTNIANATGRMQYLEVLVSITLYYIRSYFPDRLANQCLASVHANEGVRMASVELLSLIISELVEIVGATSGIGLVNYLKDMLNRCRMQKAVLCCLLASMQIESSTESEECLYYEDSLAFQNQLIALLRQLIVLESRFSTATQKQSNGVAFKIIHAMLQRNEEELRQLTSPKLLHYVHSNAISTQPMFTAALLLTLQSEKLIDMHCQWIRLVIACLPNLGSALGIIATTTINQLCNILEKLFHCVGTDSVVSDNFLVGLPPNYCTVLFEGMTIICHYCLLDNVYSHSNSLLSSLPWGMGDLRNQDKLSSPSINTGLIILAIMNSYEPTPPSQSSVIPTREGMATVVGRIMTCFSLIWDKLDDTNTTLVSSSDISRKIIRYHVMQLTTPIAMNHCFVLISAIGYAWHALTKPVITDESNILEQILPEVSKEQLALIDIVANVKALSIDTVTENVKLIVRNVLSNKKQVSLVGTCLEVDVLSFFYQYSQKLPLSSLQSCWQNVSSLIKECVQLSLSNHGLFVLLGILYVHVQRLPVVDDRKILQDRQDILQKLIQACSIIVGSALQQTTWLRRNLVVVAPSASGSQNTRSSRLSESDSSPSTDKIIDESNTNEMIVSQNVQALTILADMLAPLVDSVFSSVERDRVSNVLSSLMSNVTPYLKNHCLYNAASYTASAKLLATLTNYQYTRRAWQKDVYELFMDSNFFRMGSSSICGWRIILDNLMANDNIMFKDLLNRISISSTASLNLFTSRDQEITNCSQNLKRLSFVLLSGEKDQYQGFLPDIQERLADGLRLPLVPPVHEQIFFCFRILLLRMSSHHMTSLWPTIITELVQVLQIIEQALTVRDPSSVKLPNGIILNDPAWLPLYLSACKLLDLALALPSERLTQFQSYRWAFVTEQSCSTKANVIPNKKHRSPLFKPRIELIAGLLNDGKISPPPRVPGKLMLTMQSITSIQDLQHFFLSYVKDIQTDHECLQLESMEGFSIDRIERIIELDFIDPLQD